MGGQICVYFNTVCVLCHWFLLVCAMYAPRMAQLKMIITNQVSHAHTSKRSACASS